MDPDHWREVSRLFAAAAALDRSDRDAYLTKACAGNTALRAELDSMLAAHDDAGSFGDTPAFDSPSQARRLTPGVRLGAFLVEGLLGAGGMGEVYRAHDTRLGRAVAIKVLPDAVAHDAGRRGRFEQEARALASLNHPNVGAIYGVEESGGIVALVLELVEGPTLAERLAAGPLPIDEIVTTARQIADALEAAHDHGIVHRDLKPANIKITPEGAVKVLDFGLAKATGPKAPEAAAESRTVSFANTRAGVIVGTAAYMSPEQARGHPVDKRTDIWAFGCVLFELCTRRPAFAGATMSDTLAAVIEREPDWALLAPGTPAPLTRLLRRCLTKDPRLRLRDIGEARIALTAEPDADRVDPPSRTRRAPVPAVVAVTGLAALFAGAAVYYGTGSAPPSRALPVRFQVFPPEGGIFVRHPARSSLAVSPDGSQLAFLAATDRIRVWVRPMADLEARPVAGTEGALSMFWSPDGRALAFFADGALKRVDLAGGGIVTLCDVPSAGVAHGTWGANGDILFGTSQGLAIMRVTASGGSPIELLTPDRANGDARVHWPWFLPDGRRFLYTARRDDGDGELRLGDLGGPTRALMSVASNAQWIDPDVVAFVREGVLMGQRVNLDAARTVGEPFVLADHVEYMLTSSRAMFSASPGGTMAYQAYGDVSQLVWADRQGNELENVGSPADYEFQQSAWLSPDGGVLLTARRRPGLGTTDIWRLDLSRGTEERLTSDRGVEDMPVLADDGRTLYFSADRRGSIPNVFRKDLVSGVEEQVLSHDLQQSVMDVIPGQRAILYLQRSRRQTFDIFRLPLDAGGSPVPVYESPLDKFDARASPDGRAIAFVATDGTRTDLYVTPLPVAAPPILAATGVSGAARWSRDSRQLYYAGPDGRMMGVPVETVPSLSVGKPRALFQMKRPALLFNVSPDGRFLLLVKLERAGNRPISVATAAIGSGRP